MPKFKAVIFDLDGVITNTASVHTSAWKATFDEYLKQREKRHGEKFKEFTKEDYLNFVDGKPRYKGVESFLASRGISIPYGNINDTSKMETVCGLGNQKNIEFNKALKKNGAETFKPVVALIEELARQDIPLGVASSSKNCQAILKNVDLENYFKTRVDGVVSAELGLKGKPEGDIFVKAAENLNVKPQDSIVIEDAVSGVQAGRNGGFGLVIGVAREGNDEELKKNGADVVVKNFKGISIKGLDEWFQRKNN